MDIPEVTHTDCRSPAGETVQMIDSAILMLRLAARSDLSPPEVRAALRDLGADQEVRAVLWLAGIGDR